VGGFVTSGIPSPRRRSAKASRAKWLAQVGKRLQWRRENGWRGGGVVRGWGVVGVGGGGGGRGGGEGGGGGGGNAECVRRETIKIRSVPGQGRKMIHRHPGTKSFFSGRSVFWPETGRWINIAARRQVRSPPAPTARTSAGSSLKCDFRLPPGTAPLDWITFQATGGPRTFESSGSVDAVFLTKNPTSFKFRLASSGVVQATEEIASLTARAASVWDES